MDTTTHLTAYMLDRDTGVTDLWWPYGPDTGRYSIKASGEQSEGRLLQMLVSDTRGAATPMHVHRDADETFYVVSGGMAVFVGDDRLDLGPGDYAFGPRGVPHAFVVTADRVEVLITYASAGVPGPEGYGVHGFFKEVAVPVVPGEDRPAPRQPDQELFARRMDVYGIDLVGPPPEV